MGTAFRLRFGGEEMYLRISGKFLEQRTVWDSLRHCNAACELHIVLEGTCCLEVGNDRLTLTPGTAVLIPPGIYHAPSELSPAFSRFSLSFSPEPGPLRQRIEAGAGKQVLFRIPAPIGDLCSDIYREYASEDPCREEMLHSLFTQLLIRVFRFLGIWDAQNSEKMSLVDEDRTDRIDHFFGENFAKMGGEAALAEELHLSKRQLARVLQRYYGMGFRQKLIATRMERAAWLIRAGEMTNQQIMEAVGYASEAAFYQVFRRYHQMTPQQYRERCIHEGIVVDRVADSQYN